MAFPTAVNSQITDSVSQANVTVLGLAPAQALGGLGQIAAQSGALSMQNAVANQQSLNEVNVAVVTAAVNSILAAGGSAKGG